MGQSVVCGVMYCLLHLDALASAYNTRYLLHPSYTAQRRYNLRNNRVVSTHVRRPQELGAWSGALVLNQVLCSIGYVSTSQLYVGQQRMTAPEEEDKVDGAEERPLVTCVEPSMSLEQVQQLLTERCVGGRLSIHATCFVYPLCSMVD